jgi:3',5'-cyclic AMP phosphodiesterase CpdA
VSHRILHLSDTHVTASGFDQDGVNALASLDRILRDCRTLDGLDLVVVTGDIADDGSAEGCRLVRQRVAAFAAEYGIPHLYATGNHDRRPEFTDVLGTGHIGVDGDDIGQLLDGCGEERAAVSYVRGLRVVTLDSLVPGSVHGVISDAQLEALSGLLATPAPAGTILAFHHPPLHIPTASWMERAGLHNRDALRDAIDGSDVIAVLCGHFHAQLYGQLGGAGVWVTPGVVTRVDLTGPTHLLRAVKGAGASVVELGGPFSPAFHVLHARDPEAGQQVYLIDPATGQSVDDEFDIPQPASAS